MQNNRFFYKADKYDPLFNNLNSAKDKLSLMRLITISSSLLSLLLISYNVYFFSNSNNSFYKFHILY